MRPVRVDRTGVLAVFVAKCAGVRVARTDRERVLLVVAVGRALASESRLLASVVETHRLSTSNRGCLKRALSRRCLIACYTTKGTA